MGSNPTLGTYDIIEHIMILGKHKHFIFIHLEKCGGTSVENALAPYLLWDDIIMGSTHFGEQLQAFYFNYHGHQNVKANPMQVEAS